VKVLKNMMNRKEFKSLLTEWNKNFINEKTIPQLQNIPKLGHSSSDSIVKKSRQLNGWLTYLTVWHSSYEEGLKKYSPETDKYWDIHDSGEKEILNKSVDDINDPDTMYSDEFKPYAESLGFKVESVSAKDKILYDVHNDVSIIRLGPKLNKGEELTKLLKRFVGEEAQKILVSNCCSDSDPLFIVPFDITFTVKSGGERHLPGKPSFYKKVDEKTEKQIMHWMIHDMWHLIPERFTSSLEFSKASGVEAFKSFEKDSENRKFADAVSFSGEENMSDEKLEALGLSKEDDIGIVNSELADFFNKTNISGPVVPGTDDIGPSVFSYVLTHVESESDIDEQMSHLSEATRKKVKLIFNKAPEYWNNICSYFDNQIIIFSM
jgi:hypothetical protein